MDLDKLKRMFRIENWDIQIIEEKTLDVCANTKLIYNDYLAVIRIKEEMSDAEKERSIIHELLHLIHRDEMDIVTENLDEKTEKFYMRFHEQSIEQMAKIIYSLIAKEEEI